MEVEEEEGERGVASKVSVAGELSGPWSVGLLVEGGERFPFYHVPTTIETWILETWYLSQV